MAKSIGEIFYENKEKKSFFRNDEERNLWIRLNAERIQYYHKTINNIDKQDLGSIDEKFSPLWISNNQLIYDEYMEDAPRFSLEELSAMNHDELLELSQERNKETIKRLYEKFSLDDFNILNEDDYPSGEDL